MQSKPWWLALGLAVMAAGSANAEIVKGIMAVRGAEMS